MPTLDELILLTKEVCKSDPIDFGDLPFEENELFKLLGITVLEMGQYDKTVLMATVLKLVIENFVLNYQLLKLKN